MAEQDSAPLSAEEREELEALREEKARREREEQDRRDRAELEALRAEQRRVDDEILAERARGEAKGRAVAGSASRPVSEPVAPHGSRPRPAASEHDLTLGQRLVKTPDARDDDGVPGMAPAQKLVILVALVFVILGAIYVATRR